MTLQVGLTGGIGVGKTTVSKILSHLGVPTFNSDLCSKDILKKNIRVKKDIKKIFGNCVIDHSGEINKKELSCIVFSDKKKLQFLNNLIHPIVMQRYNKWLSTQKTNYIIKESALLFEAGVSSKLNKIILIKAPVSLRIKRVSERDKRTKKEIQNIIVNQIEPSHLYHKVDFVINNNGGLLTPKIIKLHNQLLNCF